jgi:hypothetical protein
MPVYADSMKKLIPCHVLLFVLLLLAPQESLCSSSSPEPSLISFAHLEKLSETIRLAGDLVDIVHVYAKYPDYHWVEARDAGIEGTACVDDGARAGVLYLKEYERSGSPKALTSAKRHLNLILKMQAKSGAFFNFVRSDHSINTDGRTSLDSFDWWTVRAFCCLAHGLRVFSRCDKPFAAKLEQSLARVLPVIRKSAGLLTGFHEEKGYKIPRWLALEGAADVSSELMIGLTEYYRFRPDKEVAGLIRILANGLMLMQEGDTTRFPYGLFRSSGTVWHAWGNSQSQALAYAGRILQDFAMIGSAEREARGFYNRLLIGGMMKEFDITDPTKAKEFEQIAYGIRPMVACLTQLYRATHKREYLIMAGLAGSWLFGNNPAGEPVYDAKTGRGYDGIGVEKQVNLNSGAESTIEALLALMEIEDFPLIRPYLHFRRVSSVSSGQLVYAEFRDPSNRLLVLVLYANDGVTHILEGPLAERFLRLKKDSGFPINANFWFQ